MLKISIETELKAVSINVPSFDPLAPLEAFIIEIRHALVGMGYHHRVVDAMLSLRNNIDDEIEGNPDDNPPEDKH